MPSTFNVVSVCFFCFCFVFQKTSVPPKSKTVKNQTLEHEKKKAKSQGVVCLNFNVKDMM